MTKKTWTFENNKELIQEVVESMVPSVALKINGNSGNICILKGYVLDMDETSMQKASSLFGDYVMQEQGFTPVCALDERLSNFILDNTACEPAFDNFINLVRQEINVPSSPVSQYYAMHRDDEMDFKVE